METGARAFVVVLDACGVGAFPDADQYGDAGSHTLAHLAQATGGLALPTLERLGLGNLADLRGVTPSREPVAHGRLAPLGGGKDTMAGHWELMGASTGAPPVYPDGFPAEVIDAFVAATGRGVIGNAASEGLAAIAAHGPRQLETGELIVYTSQDSVFQVAAHTSVLSERELHGHCATAREILSGEHAVGRVIARPFEGEPGAFRRTAGRRDFALPPRGRTYLDELHDRDVPVHAVGKVGQVFAGQGIEFDHPAPDNPTGIVATSELIGGLPEGLVFTNLVDTDQVYGHRKDVAGFHAALQEIDAAVARWLRALRARDLLVLTADHGCDPAHPGSDHTREYVPLLALFEGHAGRSVDGPMARVGASVLAWLTGARSPLPGEPFVAGGDQ